MARGVTGKPVFSSMQNLSATTGTYAKTVFELKLPAGEYELRTVESGRKLTERRVRIKSGPLRGVEGWVEKRHGADTVLLRLDFISQAAAVKLGAEMLEPV